MGFQYNLTAVEILKQLGYVESVGKERLVHASQQKNMKLPSILFDFLSLAANSPLLSTADLWTHQLDPFYFLYDEIEEYIDGDQELWESNPDEYADNEYFQLSQLPKECWESRVPNYLLIGSDQGAGIVEFGIRLTEVEQDNPPVYMHHECNPIADWQLWNHSLSSFLVQILCDVLCCANYDTAVRVLTKAGWTSRPLSQEDLAAYEIDTAAMLTQKTLYRNGICGCAYDEEKKRLLVAQVDESKGKTFKGMEYQKNDA